ncbi:Uncharacterized protein DAT39_016932 [Clarias magur]|uniref:Uncharacterized protein n=1 Tax=Clarias magur TaxID=1594786 RepID=A0A8J4WVF5_CLAMG|nr:Uncharacterized protein DAT39_016932 [Clarias magur]
MKALRAVLGRDRCGAETRAGGRFPAESDGTGTFLSLGKSITETGALLKNDGSSSIPSLRKEALA